VSRCPTSSGEVGSERPTDRPSNRTNESNRLPIKVGLANALEAITFEWSFSKDSNFCRYLESKSVLWVSDVKRRSYNRDQIIEEVPVLKDSVELGYHKDIRWYNSCWRYGFQLSHSKPKDPPFSPLKIEEKVTKTRYLQSKWISCGNEFIHPSWSKVQCVQNPHIQFLSFDWTFEWIRIHGVYPPRPGKMFRYLN